MTSENARILSTPSSTEKHLKHDVFVLSPSSLQKLGIHLDSIQQDKAINSHINDVHVTSDIRASPISDQKQLLKTSNGGTSSQSSMSETANLMKSSVFLSPTFEMGNDNKESKTNCHSSYKTGDMELSNGDTVDIENSNESNNLTIQSVNMLIEPAPTNTEIKSVLNTPRVKKYTSITDKTMKDNNAQTSLKSPQSIKFQSNNKNEIERVHHEEKLKICSLNKGHLKDFVLVNLKGGSHTIIKDNIPATKHKQNYVRDSNDTYSCDIKKTDNIKSSCSLQDNILNNTSLTNDNILEQKIAIQRIENPCSLDKNSDYIVKKSENCKTFKPLYKKRKHPQNDIIKQNIHSVPKNELEINMTESVDALNRREENFCVCFDFGYLCLPLDSGTEYQHTHFDNKVSVDSTLEELFVDKYGNNLFEDVIKIHNEDVEHNIVSSTCTSSTCADICWKSLDHCSLFDECENIQDLTDNSTHIDFEEKGCNISQKTVDNVKESVIQKAFDNVIDNGTHHCFNDIRKSSIQKDMIETTSKDDLIPIYIVVNEDIDAKKSKDECNNTEKSLDTEKDSDEELSMPLSQYKKHIKNQQIMDIASTGHSKLLEDNRDKKKLKRKRLSKETPTSQPSKYRKTYSSQKQPIIENHEINNTLSTSNLTFDMSTENIEDESLFNDTTGGLEQHAKSDIVCGVCFEPIQNSSWIDHIEKKHHYIAWKKHEHPFDVKDEFEVHSHLQQLAKQIGGLKCSYCGINRKYVKPFLEHVKNCEFEESSRNKEYEICGVCKEKVKFELWYEHIMVKHDYMAWKIEDPPLDLEDADAVNNHLDGLYKELGRLTCSKCGSHWKYKKKYLSHIKRCSINEETETTITCGVCNEELSSDMWLNHIEKQHSYIAWKVGQPVLDINDDEELHQHLKEVWKILKRPLICSKCGLSRKYVKAYINHIKTCNNDAEGSKDEDNFSIKYSNYAAETDVVCSICEETMKYNLWLNHLKNKHKYLAWRRGQQPLIALDKQSIENHLQKISDEFGCLACPYCEKSIKQAAAYQQHITKCIAEQNQLHTDTCIEEEDEYVLDGNMQDATCCGVCNKNVLNSRWYDHIQSRHNYLAWKKGAPPLDIRNEQSIRTHLSSILAVTGILRCSCGFGRKNAIVFSRHMSMCEIHKNQTKALETDNNNDTVTCALCSKEMTYATWSEHSLTEHYNLAWIKGTPPIDYSSNAEVERFLKIYKSKGFEFECNYCGVTRASHVGFFVHVLTCNKKDEEIEQYKELCEICNTKYLCINRYQHRRIHEIQQRKEEEKKLMEAKRNMENEINSGTKVNSSQRRAAQRARKVIDLYRTSEDLNTECNSSGQKDDTEDFQREQSDSSSDESVNSADNEDGEQKVRDRSDVLKTLYEPFFVTAKTLPMNVKNPLAYLERSYIDFCNEHMSLNNLYSPWKHGVYEFLDETQMKRYLPKLEVSCKVSMSNKEWSTYKRFESRYSYKVFSVFLGGTPQCLAWAPPSNYLKQVEENQYLAVSTHKESLVASVQYNELYIEPNIIQIWNFYTFKETSTPTLDLCIAHDFGIVWSMAWCPSGVRDVSNEGNCRLGLLATACSNGYVYIYSVPLPTTSSEVKFCKLKPVAELRLCSTQDRKMFQPTKVYWSMKRGHSIVYVGYADGSVAFFDLNIESPILRCEENGVTILYPYHEDRTYSMPVQDISTYVCASGYDGEALSVATMNGIMTSDSMGPSPLLIRRRECLCPAGVKFLPQWPSIHIASNDLGIVQRMAELEFGGGECRRVGTAIKICGCMCCGNTATFAPPFVRIIRAPHPVLPQYRRRNVAIIKMAPLKKPSRKRVQDDIAVKIEPKTYDEAVRNYGLHFQSIYKNERKFGKKTEDTEVARFPLSDVLDIAFCPNSKLHTQLAISTRSGLLFVTPVVY